ncbi:hypothetical protein D9613_012403 [Agrocybe pediades]|uniref:Uncharacterized protein n=1 Tax=Agrocybe pediades TaxID=84607 RepID=A0A8H4QS60_9AGAR|nr:hypothetical protein D9613_012403 [Agrocybe pediades]
MNHETVGAAPPPPTPPPATNAMQMPLPSAPSVLHPGGRGARPSNIASIIAQFVVLYDARTRHQSTQFLSEQYIQDVFHSYLKSSLAQAKAERLLADDVLASAEGDLMITGPALCLYFAALRCTTNPPSVPLPRSRSKSTTSTSSARQNSNEPHELSYDNCPPAFVSFLRVWAETVPSIQALVPESQHDLARVICGLPPLSAPADSSSSHAQEQLRTINGIAADLRAVAIEISQRRSFQDRYASDLQAALDASTGGGAGGSSRGSASGTESPRRTTSFVPPPMYDESVGTAPPAPPATNTAGSSTMQMPSPSVPSNLQPGGRGSRPSNISVPPNSTSGGLLSPPYSASSSSSRPHSPTPSTSSTSASGSQTPPLLAQSINFIRETLYSALFDVLQSQSSLRLLLNQDKTRAYFACVAFAILHVATTSVDPETGAVRGVLGKELTLAECPRELQPFMRELGEIGREARRMMEEDDEWAIRMVQEGREDELAAAGAGREGGRGSRMDRVRRMLEEGVGYELRAMGVSPPPSTSASTTNATAAPTANDGLTGNRPNATRSRRSLEGRAVAFANRINGLSLGMTKLRAFRERQEDVFAILGAGG